MSDGIDYQTDLEYTRRIRMKLIDNFIDKEGKPTSDEKEARVLLTALKDMDKSTIDAKRNAIDESKGGEAREVMQAVHEFFQLQKNQNPFTTQGEGNIPTLDASKLPQFEHVEGEDSIISEQQTADDFISVMSARKREKDAEEETNDAL